MTVEAYRIQIASIQGVRDSGVGARRPPEILARHYLETSRLSIQNIAYLLDYSEAAAFTRAFKREFGFSPQEYRDEALRRGPEPPESTDQQRFGRWVVR